jgi:hypothetical protein
MHSHAELSDDEIKDICGHLDLPLVGVYMKDELKKKMADGFYVVNMASRNDKNNPDGSHWVCCFKGYGRNTYFDSFGIVAPREIDAFLCHDYVYNKGDIQYINSNSCGWYCIAFMHFFYTHYDMTPSDIIVGFNQLFNQERLKRHDDLLLEYFSK